MNSKWLISRRALLGGVAGAAASVILRPRRALGQSTSPPPKRFVYVFSANGTIPENWRPSGSETTFTLSPILAPLERFKSKLLLLEGVDMKSTQSGIGDGHQKGMCHMLTATNLMPGPFPGGGNAGPAGYAGGISVDQEIANHVGARSRFRSLEFGVRCGSANNWSRMCYRGPDMPIPPMEDPFEAYARIFGDAGGDVATVRARLLRRQSVLDHATRELTALGSRLSAADRQRLEAYHEALRDIERRLSMSAAAACSPPTQGERFSLSDAARYPEIGRLHMDLMVAALACDLTRVTSLQWSRSVSQTTFPWLGFADRHHDLSHEGDSNTTARDKLTRINRWYSEQFAYLLGRLDAIPEGSGTLLDNTVVLWGNELGKGNSHTRNNVPWVMAGSCGGYFRTGRYLRYEGASHSDLLVSLCQAMGLPTRTFGNPTYCNGPLPRLR